VRVKSSGIVVAAALLATAGLALAVLGSRSDHDSGAAASPSPTVLPLTGLPAEEVMNRALAATAEVSTLHIRTTADTSSTHLVFDLRRTANGDCYGQITFDAGTVSAILTEDHTYVRGSATFWRKIDVPDVSSEMAMSPGLWARTPRNDTYRGFCDVNELPNLVGLHPVVFDELRAGPARFGRDGRTVVDLTGRDSMWKVTVDAKAPHYLLDLRAFGAHAELSEFNQATSVRIPTSDEYVAFDSDAPIA